MIRYRSKVDKWLESFRGCRNNLNRPDIYCLTLPKACVGKARDVSPATLAPATLTVVAVGKFLTKRTNLGSIGSSIWPALARSCALCNIAPVVVHRRARRQSVLLSPIEDLAAVERRMTCSPSDFELPARHQLSGPSMLRPVAVL